MTARPTATELVEAVSEFLESEILPALDDRRLAFRMRVALNGLGIALRELAAGDGVETLSDDDLGELAVRLRNGEMPDGALELLRRHVAAELRIASPRYLERYEGNNDAAPRG